MVQTVLESLQFHPTSVSDMTVATVTLLVILVTLLGVSVLRWRASSSTRCSADDPALLAVRLNACAARLHSCARPNATGELTGILGLKARWMHACLAELGVTSPSLLLLLLSTREPTLRTNAANQLLAQRKESTRIAAHAQAETICAKLNSAVQDHFVARKRQIQARDELRIKNVVNARQAIQQRQQCEDRKQRRGSTVVATTAADGQTMKQPGKLSNMIANVGYASSPMIKSRSIYRCSDPEQLALFHEFEPNAFCGVLHKRKTTRLPLWHARYFRIGTCYLQYFADEAGAHQNNLLAVIDLRKVVRVRFANKDSGGGATEFVLELPRGRLLALRASSPVVAGRWVSELDMTVTNLKSMDQSAVDDPLSPPSNPTQRRFWASLRPWSTSRSPVPAPQSTAVLLTKAQSCALQDMKQWAVSYATGSGLLADDTAVMTLVELSDTWLVQHLRATQWRCAAAEQLWRDNFCWRRGTRGSNSTNSRRSGRGVVEVVSATKPHTTLTRSAKEMIDTLSMRARSPLELTPVNGAVERKAISASLQSAWPDRFIGVDHSGNPIEMFTLRHIDPKLLRAERGSRASFVSNLLKVLVDKCEISNSMLCGMSMVEGRVVASSCLIVDMQGFSAATHMASTAMLLTALRALRTRYPARFARVLIVRAPWEFAAMYDMLMPASEQQQEHAPNSSATQSQGGEMHGSVFWLADEHEALLNQLQAFMPLMSVPAQLRGSVTTIAA